MLDQVLALAGPWLPPIVANRLRILRRGHNFAWQGIYQHRREVPVQSAYDHPSRVRGMLKEAHAMRAAYASAQPPHSEHDQLGILATSLVARHGRVRVLDVGGGLGTAYTYLESSITGSASIEHHVVELEDVCAAGRVFFASNPSVHYHSALPSIHGQVDIVYANSVLPYLDEYADTLRRLADLRAPYLLLARLAAGHIPTYASEQHNMPGPPMAYWFHNLDEIVRIVSEAGYALVFDGYACREDQRNFPLSHRIDHFRNLLFVLR